MATLFPGSAPEILTVSASPAPTSTVFTVSSATNLIVGQWINVEVSGDFERAKITGITGNQLTVTGLSGAPDVPGEVRNTRALIAISHIQQAGLFEASDIADLKTVDTTYAPEGLKYQVQGVGIFRLSISSSVAANDYNVVAPTTGPGRWILESASSSEAVYTAELQIGPLIQEIDALKRRIATLEAAKTSWVKQVNTGAISIATVTEYDHLIEVPDFTLRDTDSITVNFPFPPPTGLWILGAWMHSQTGQIYVRLRNNSGSTITINSCQLTVKIMRTDT